MARTTQLSKEKRQSIITLRLEGQSIRNIARTLKVSPSAVMKTINRCDETGSYEDRPRTGRPRITSAAEDKFIKVTSLKNRKLTAPQLTALLNDAQTSGSSSISTSTVKRRLREAGVYDRIAAKKSLQRTANRQRTAPTSCSNNDAPPLSEQRQSPSPTSCRNNGPPPLFEQKQSPSPTSCSNNDPPPLSEQRQSPSPTSCSNNDPPPLSEQRQSPSPTSCSNNDPPPLSEQRQSPSPTSCSTSLCMSVDQDGLHFTIDSGPQSTQMRDT